MSDFKLSDKIRSWLDYKEKMIDVKDVKEFIRLLKEKFQEGCYSYLGTKSEVMGLNCDGKHWLCSACETKLREIDKLAGDELNERI